MFTANKGTFIDKKGKTVIRNDPFKITFPFFEGRVIVVVEDKPSRGREPFEVSPTIRRRCGRGESFP